MEEVKGEDKERGHTVIYGMVGNGKKKKYRGREELCNNYGAKRGVTVTEPGEWEKRGEGEKRREWGRGSETPRGGRAEEGVTT